MKLYQDFINITPDAYRRNPSRYFLFDGRRVEENEIPAEIRDRVIQMSTKEYLDSTPPTNLATENDFCSIFSSKPATIKKYSTIGVPALAFKEITNQAPDVTEQFVSEDTDPDRVYIGIFLKPDIPSLRLSSISIVTRVPLDPIDFSTLDPNHPVAPVPTPKTLQVFGTKSDTLEQAIWTPVTGRILVSSDTWNFMRQTTLPCISDDLDPKAIQAYRGFKVVFLEWDYSHARDDDRLPGISRIQFNFIQEDIDIIKSCVRYVLPAMRADDGICIVGYDKHPEEGILEAEEVSQPTLELSQELMDKAIEQVKDTCIKEIQDALIEQVVTAARNVSTEIVNDALKRADTTITERADKTAKMIKKEVETLHNQADSRIKNLLSHDSIAAILKEDPTVTALQSRLDDVDQLKETIVNIRDYTNSVVSELQSKLDDVNRLSMTVANICDYTNLVVLEDFKVENDVYKKPLKKMSGISKFFVVNDPKSTRKPYPLEISIDTSSHAEGDIIEIINMRSDGGEVKICLDNGLFSIVNKGKTYGNLTDISLTERGETVVLYNFADTWTGKITD